MKRALVLVLSVAALAAGCGGGSGSGSSAGSSSGGSSSVSTNTAASVLTAASAATKDATSAAFQANLGIKVQGNLQGAGAGAALLQGPLSLALKGHAGKGGNGTAKFDVNFSFNYTGGSFSGRALSPDGKTLYLQMPALMGPGWHSIPLSGITSGSGSSTMGGSSTSKGLDQLKAAGLDPAKWLKNLNMSSSGGQDTISADLNLPAVFADIAKAGASSITAKDKLQMAQVTRAVKKAHGSLSFDSSTHLPTDEQLDFDMVLPPALAAQASGLKGLALNLDIKFSDWNQDFSVSAPSGATPLNTGGLLGGIGA